MKSIIKNDAKGDAFFECIQLLDWQLDVEEVGQSPYFVVEIFLLT